MNNNLRNAFQKNFKNTFKKNISLKKILQLTAVLTLAMGVANPVAANLTDSLCLEPYIGADAQMRYFSFKNDFGSNLFKKFNPQANVYLGLRLHDYFGVEAGYYSTVIQHNTVFIPAGTPVLGVTLEDPIRRNTSLHLHGLYGNLVAFIPIHPTCNLEAIVFAGFAHHRVRFNIATTEVGGEPGFLRFTFRKTKNTARVGVGLQRMFTECVGIRGSIFWENLSRFADVHAQTFTGLETIKMQDSFTASLGLFFKF